jgi:hypothetical protein
VLDGEGGFAASGTCVVAGSDDRGWVASGNAARARILSTSDRGRSWTVQDAPVDGGTMTGLFTIDVKDRRGVALGGAVGADSVRGRFVAVSRDGGASWQEGGTLAMSGAVYGAGMVPGLEEDVVVAVGPGGLDWSVDGGETWSHVDDREFWAVGFASPEVGWAVGPQGRVVRLAIERASGG